MASRMKEKRRSKKDKIREGIEGIFGEHADKILEMIEANDTDSALALTKKQLLASNLSLIPDLEKLVRDSEGKQGVYQYTQLVTTARGLIEDLQAMQDTGLIADSINLGLVRPTFRLVTQFMVDSHFRLRNELLQIVTEAKQAKARKLVDDTAKSVAAFMQEESKELCNKIQSRICD